MKQRRTGLHLLVLSGLSVVLTLSALEVVVRSYFFAEIDPAILRRTLEGDSVRTLMRPSEDPALLFELKPNERQRFQGRWVKTGEGGYRVTTAIAPPHPTARPTVRIAVIGDSSSFGWGVTYEETYPERYRLRLQELAGMPIELRNYSVPAYNAAQELRAFQTKVKAYHPDVILLHHDHNDSEPTTRVMGNNYMPVEYGDNPLHSALIKWALRRLRQDRIERARAAAEKGNRSIDGYVVSGPLYTAHLEARRQLVEEAKGLGIPVVIVIFNTFVKSDPHYETSEYYVALHRDLRIRLEEMGYHAVDLYPRYQEVLRQRGWANLVPWWVTPKDGHPNAKGHEFIADSLVDYTLRDARLSALFGMTLAGRPDPQ